MLNWMKKVAMSVAAMAVIGGGSIVFAETVTYSTVGSFSVAVASPDSANAGVFLSTPGAVTDRLTLGFTGSVGQTSGTLPIAGIVGQFHFSYPGTTFPSTKTFAPGDKFTLALTQSLPGVGGGSSSTSLINGTVILNNNFTGNASLDIVFANPTNPITFFTNGEYYSYKIRDIHLPTNSAPGNLDPFLVADISAVAPLPKTASMGLAMFGVLGVVAGGAALRRRSIAIA